jgi:hypothetical protein
MKKSNGGSPVGFFLCVIGRMGGWKDGRMEGWKDGRMEGWKDAHWTCYI